LSSDARVQTPDVFSITAQRPARCGAALRRLHRVASPARIGVLLRLFDRLQLLRRQRAQLRLLTRLARLFTPDVADQVAALAHTDPEAALEVFVREFEREYFELDETVCEQGFEVWADIAGESIPIVVRGTDRCNGIDPLGCRPGYAMQWALIQDVFNGERSQLIAEVAQVFGEALADRLAAADPPAHQTLCQRLARSPYRGVVSFSRWTLGDTANSILFLHAHHANELIIPWTRRGISRAARLIRTANDFEAPALALARWLERAPVEHGPLLVDAVLGGTDGGDWSRTAIRPCGSCGFPPIVDTWQEANSRRLLDEAPHRTTSTPTGSTRY
jgi:hypothetical protein